MTPIETPCTKVCLMDRRSGLCRGCGRTLDEIAGWADFDPAERARIMTELPRRALAVGAGERRYGRA